jgi:endonuclease/exonuclease/phosphatase family metal-dependent hydrolase
MPQRIDRIRLGCLAAFLSLLVLGCEHAEPPSLRTATLNIAHGRGLAVHQIGLRREAFEDNLAGIATLLRREAPEVVALQEADAPSAWSGMFDHVAQLADQAAYPHRYLGLHVDFVKLGLPTRYGTALLSRRPMALVESKAFAEGLADSKGFVLAQIEFAGRPLVVVSVHLDFKSARTRRKQAAKLVDRLKRCAVPLVVMGDFNCGWDDPDDGLRLVARELDLQAWRPMSRDAAHSTFRSLEPAVRIDWILISRELVFRTYRCWPDQVSDHRGVMANVAWRHSPR